MNVLNAYVCVCALHCTRKKLKLSLHHLLLWKVLRMMIVNGLTRKGGGEGEREWTCPVPVAYVIKSSLARKPVQ